ncbi:MAG: hypothetical protein GY718_18560 [Lentisphaerae bacterium]|nr:hypothetical protein [Lentisphaerota bacterium]
MKKVIFDSIETVALGNVSERTPVFAKDNKGKLLGMVVSEKEGWITRTGGDCGASGHFSTRMECMEASLHLGFTYFVE